jgi:hypothetical protein
MDPRRVPKHCQHFTLGDPSSRNESGSSKLAILCLTTYLILMGTHGFSIGYGWCGGSDGKEWEALFGHRL